MTFTLLIAEDDALQAKLLARVAAEAGFDVTVMADGDVALAELRTSPPDALFTDLRLPGADGLALIAAAREADVGMPVILATGYATAHNTVEAFHLGVTDVLFKPLELDALKLTLKRLKDGLAQRRRIDQLTALLSAQLAAHEAPPLMESRAPAMKQCLTLAAQVADKDLPVLLEGETGAGKGVVAAHIHRLSVRRDGPFLGLNCGALPPTLLESELFGFEKGAFSGATARKPGLLELAHGGTLFLDEINSTSLDAQTRLLQFIQDRRLMRLGGVKAIDVDVRLILASNRPLKEEVAAGRFRQDLYFRVNVFPISVPALRARREDIPALAEWFLARQRAGTGRRDPAGPGAGGGRHPHPRRTTRRTAASTRPFERHALAPGRHPGGSRGLLDSPRAGTVRRQPHPGRPPPGHRPFHPVAQAQGRK